MKPHSKAGNLVHATIVLNIHREAVFLRRTLLSLAEAANFAHAMGQNLELVAVLDETDDETRQVLHSFEMKPFAGTRVIDVSNNSLSASRNDGIRQASGEFIFTADADDLVSYNYYSDILKNAYEKGRNALHFPEVVFGFGDDYFIALYQGSEAVPPKAFLDGHPYISRVCAHRDVFCDLAFADIDPLKGYAYEDWHFNAQAVAAGMDIQTVPGTILFYRQRPGSLLRISDAASVRQIPPTRLFKPTIYLDASRRHEQASGAQRENSQPPAAPDATKCLADAKTKDITARANALDPSISLEKYGVCRIHRNFAGPYPLGTAYLGLCDIIRDRDFSDVFLHPVMAVGGAEKYFLNLAEAMYAIDPFKEFLVILGQDTDTPPWTNHLPPNVVVLDMAVHCRSLSLDQRCMLALKIIETCSPGTRVHLRESAFADRLLDLYGIVLKDRQIIYYRLPDAEIIRDGRPTIVHSPLEIIARNIDCLSKIVCDSATTIRKDHHRLGIQMQKWHCLHAPVTMPAAMPAQERGVSRRVLWASRLDMGKRPLLLRHIASYLNRKASDVHLDVFGEATLTGFDPSTLKHIANLQYHGRYDGFDSLPLSRYSVLIFTSLHDGIPNVILEAMSHGLAVVAPDIGSISEVVVDGETGILLPSLPDDHDMAASYGEAILALINDPDHVRRLVENGQALVRRRHAPDVHKQRVAELFDLQQRHFEYA